MTCTQRSSRKDRGVDVIEVYGNRDRLVVFWGCSGGLVMMMEMEVKKTNQRPLRKPYLAATCRMAFLSNLVRRPGGVVPAPSCLT